MANLYFKNSLEELGDFKTFLALDSKVRKKMVPDISDQVHNKIFFIEISKRIVAKILYNSLLM